MGISQADYDIGEGYTAGRKATLEECARIAETFKPGFCGDDQDSARWDLADAIARAIRAVGQ